MSEEFVNEFKARTKCWACPKAPFVTGDKSFSLCQKHLTYCRTKWRQMVRSRKAAGKCIQCEARPAAREQRCDTHKEINRKRCLAWSLLNPGHSQKEWEKRKLQLAAGICVCKERRPLPTGFRRCDQCRKRQGRYRRAAYAART